MPTEETRHELLSAIDKALSHTWLVSRAEQAMLRAVRSLVLGPDPVIDSDRLVDRVGALMAAQPRGEGAEAAWPHRWRWSYYDRQGGYFMRLPDGRWLQHANENGQDYLFAETGRTPDYVELHDARGFTVRLWADRFDQQIPGIPGWSSGLPGAWSG
jgi:hypothetical protein